MVSVRADLVSVFSAVVIFNVFSCFVGGLPGNKMDLIREVEELNDGEELQEAFWNEIECLQEGGICLPADECSKGHEAANGLCPSQRENGIECCHGLSNKERSCNKRGGMCRAKLQCPEAIRIPYANDCQANEICCALV